MDDSQQENETPPKPLIRYIGMGNLRVFMVPESELEEIERGSPGNLMEAIGNTLLSIFFGGLISFLLGTTPTDIYKFSALVIVMSVSFIAGIIMLILSWRQRKDTESVTKRIRARGAASVGPQVTGKMLPQAKMVIDATDEENH